MIIIEGSIRVRDMKTAYDAMRAMVLSSRAENGCVDYSYAVDSLDPTLVRVTERWESRDALKAHMRSSHLRSWRNGWAENGISERSPRLYEAETEDY